MHPNRCWPRPAFPRIPWRSTFKPMLACDQRVICRAAKRKALISLQERLLALARAFGYVQACRHSSMHACIHAACSPYACVQVCARAHTHAAVGAQPETRRRPEVAGLEPRSRLSVLAPLSSPCRQTRPLPPRRHADARPRPRPQHLDAPASPVVSQAPRAAASCPWRVCWRDACLQSARYHEPARVKGACDSGVRSPRKLRAGRRAALSWS